MGLMVRTKAGMSRLRFLDSGYAEHQHVEMNRTNTKDDYDVLGGDDDATAVFGRPGFPSHGTAVSSIAVTSRHITAVAPKAAALHIRFHVVSMDPQWCLSSRRHQKNHRDFTKQVRPQYQHYLNECGNAQFTVVGQESDKRKLSRTISS